MSSFTQWMRVGCKSFYLFRSAALAAKGGKRERRSKEKKNQQTENEAVKTSSDEKKKDTSLKKKKQQKVEKQEDIIKKTLYSFVFVCLTRCISHSSCFLLRILCWWFFSTFSTCCSMKNLKAWGE